MELTLELLFTLGSIALLLTLVVFGWLRERKDQQTLERLNDGLSEWGTFDINEPW